MVNKWLKGLVWLATNLLVLRESLSHIESFNFKALLTYHFLKLVTCVLWQQSGCNMFHKGRGQDEKDPRTGDKSNFKKRNKCCVLCMHTRIQNVCVSVCM